MGARILIVEDDPSSLELTAYLLDSAGYSTLLAREGGTGLRLALEASPDVIVCDLQMPVLNGYELVGRLKEDPGWRRVPVVAVSAFSMPGDREKALAAGFDGYLTKPITPETFVQEIAAFLPRHLRAEPPAND
jgi:two-component system, cell cycle response regulator DivK